MKIVVKQVTDRLIWLLTVALMASFVILNMVGWGRYVYVGLSAIILVLTAIGNNGKIVLRLQRYHFWSVAFVAFVYVSGLWAAYSFSASAATGTMLILTFICAAMVYVHYQDKEDVHALLTAVMWSGYLVAVYTLVYYGYDTLQQMAAESSARMENEYANVNSIGMVASLACVLQVNELTNKKNCWSVVMMIPSVIVIASTQSRKAFVMLLGGALIIAMLKSLRNKNRVKSLIRTAIVLTVVLIGLRYLLELPIFAGVLERMEGTVDSLTGANGGSSDIRARMRALGWELFTQYPLAGVGMSNTQFFAGARLMYEAYLHNNYVEILAGGGLIGFFLYYAAHLYVVSRLFKYRKADPNSFLIGMVWMGIIFVMDYGEVSFSEKNHVFYMMIHFLNVGYMEKKYKEQYNEHKQII